jgi:hypothetical protein
VNATEGIEKKPGLLDQLLALTEDTDQPFEVEFGPVVFRFRGVGDYSELQDLWDRAAQFEAALRKNLVPGIPKELRSPRAGVAGQAQFAALLALDEEMKDPLPWLRMATKRGLAFKHVMNAIDANLGVRLREAEAAGIEEKKD